MPPQLSAKAKSAGATQKFMDVKTIRDGVVVLKDDSLRLVLMASSMNFALKSTEEQDAIIYQYQNFLNSVDFPVQFVIHSRKLNIAPYLAALKERGRMETVELLKTQINEYINFVKSFVELTNIVSKTFYVIVPFFPTFAEKSGILESLRSLLWGGRTKARTDDQFEEYKIQLKQRAENVALGLQRFGVRTAPLNTEELIELFYGLYNPTEFEKGITEKEL